MAQPKLPPMKLKIPYLIALLLVIVAFFQACDTKKDDHITLVYKIIIANTDSFSVFANRPTLINPASNDSVSDGSFAISAEQPKHGQLLVAKSKAGFIYTPNPNFTGSDTARYTISQNNQLSSAWIYLTVTDSSVCSIQAQPDSVKLPQNSNGFAFNVLQNDVVCGIYSIVPNRLPKHGVLKQIGSGLFSYTPTPNFKGDDDFSYTITKGKLISQANVYVTVGESCANQLEAHTDTFNIKINSGLSLDESILKKNDFSCPNDWVLDTISVLRFPSRITTKGNTVYLNDPGYRGYYYSPPDDTAITDYLEYTIHSKSSPRVKSKALIVIKVSG